MNDRLPVVIVGGGLAGTLAALHLTAQRPEVPVLLIEAGPRLGGNHTWSFFDSDIPPRSAALIAELEPVRWPRHSVHFTTRSREFAAAYNAFDAAALDRLGRAHLAADQILLNTRVASLGPRQVLLDDGGAIPARAVIDARGPDGAMPGLELGWQKFVGIEFAAAVPDPEHAVVMDATVPQIGGYRFVYTLPLAADRVLVEDTYYADDPQLDLAAVAARVIDYAQDKGLAGAELRRESGVLPILISGDPQKFWPAHDPVARLGLAGGFFHATTGYSLRLALQLAEELAALPGPLDVEQLAAWSRARFMRHWRAMRFYRMLNRMLFRAAAPAERHKVFAHFYRLGIDRIARFYAGEPRLSDMARILSGKPPVPVGAAIRALIR